MVADVGVDAARAPVIVPGCILARLHLLSIAVGFWLAFAAGIGVLAVSGHTMTARWHLGPIEGGLLVAARHLARDPRFLFFMITDPKTTPRAAGRRVAYAVSIGPARDPSNT